MTTSGLLARAETRSGTTFSSGTVDLMGAFRALQGQTGTALQTTAMAPERRVELIEELVTLSVHGTDDLDWDLLDEIDPPAPEDYTA
jgi:hypothetical protein